MKEEISQQELDERVAILKKFRSLLEQQRAKFREYLTVLEKQQNSITSEDTEALLEHTELEQQVVAGIASLQKVIVPMSELYSTVKTTGKAPEEEVQSVSGIQNELADLQNKVLVQNEKNRNLLRVHITQIREQMQQLNNPYRTARSVYAVKQPVATLVEVEA